MRALWFALISLLTALAASAFSPSEPAEELRAGFSVARLERIRARLQRRVDARQIAGAVYRVSRDGRPVSLKAVGWSDVESQRRMETDALFRVYSMSKPVVAVAILMLVEEGRLRLTEPISRYIPEFRGQFGPSGHDPRLF